MNQDQTSTPTSSRERSHLSFQWVLVLGALVLAAWLPRAAFWVPVAAYGLLWLVLNILARKGRGIELPFSRVALLVVLIALMVGGGLSLSARKTDLAWDEGLHGLGANLSSRWDLEDLPSIAPPIVFADHPQAFYVHAPHAGRVSLDLGATVADLPGESLGEGLFRVFYNPRQHGEPPLDAAVIPVSIEVDGRLHQRRLRNVRAQAHPRWFASAPEHGLVVTTSEETDEIFLLSRQGLEQRIQVEDGPTAAAILPQRDAIAVAHRYSPELWIVEVETGEVRQRLDLGPFQTHLSLSPNGELLAVSLSGAQPRIDLIDIESFSVVGRFELTERADGLLFGRDDREVVVAHRSSKTLTRWALPALEVEGLSQGEENSWQLQGTLQLGRPVVRMARRKAREGGYGSHAAAIYVATTDFRPGGEVHRGNHFIQDQILTIDLDSWQVSQQRLTSRRTPAQREPGNLDSGLSPMGMVELQDGSLLVAFAGSDEVWQLGGAENPSAQPRVLAAGIDLDLIAPHGVGDLGEGYWAASSPAGGCLAVYAPTGELLEFIGVSPPDDDLLSAPSGSLERQALLHRSGERAFFEGTRSGISCQSCHLHGGSDESFHDIGQEPLLPTLPLGGITGTAPYLRDGSFPQIRDLDTHLAGDLYRGYQRYVEGRGKALEAFVESLPRAVNPRLLEPSLGASLDLQRAGAKAFVAARCVLCHSFPAFTNLSQHPVRSLFPEYGEGLRPINRLDTPSLLGSHDRSHFLQDGRAHSLAEVMGEQNLSNRHGDTASLSDGEESALAEFLLSL